MYSTVCYSQLSLSPQLNTNVPKAAVMDVSVSDGINEVKASMSLLVRLVTDEMLFNSITVRLDDMTKEAFLSPLLNFFMDGLAAIIPCPKESIYLFSIQVRTIRSYNYCSSGNYSLDQEDHFDQTISYRFIWLCSPAG